MKKEIRRETWKTIAILFIVLFALENLLLMWGYYITIEEQKEIDTCYYEICNEFPDAELIGNVCYCYEEGILGDYVISKTELMK